MHSLKNWRQNLMAVFGLVLAVSLALTSEALAAGSPMAEVRGLIDEVQDILRQRPSQSPAQRHQRLLLIEQVSARHIDYREMARRCLGPTWNNLNRAQQEEFVHLFSELLKSSYAGRLDDFVQARVEYQAEDDSEDTSAVRILILRENDRIPVTFRLLRKPEGWRIYDLVIEGVSLVNNYRSQFGRVIAKSSYQSLVHTLRTRMEANNLGTEAEENNED